MTTRGALFLIVCATIAIAAVSRGVVDLATVASGSLRASAPCGGLMDNLGGRSFGSRFCQDPIDVVYTWVNGSDPVWFAQMQRFRALERGLDPDAPGANASAGNSSGADAGDQAGANRYRDNEELRFSLRSLFKYAPWVRNVHLVTSGQVPAWLDVTHPRVRVVTHEEIFADPSHLPVFSSPAIEVHLHRIPGLSRRFVYFNDDVMLGADTWPADFYSPATGHRVYFSWEVPKCNTGCIDSWIGDGFCDRACNISRCMWDAGDCVGSDIKPGAGMGSSSTSSSSSSSYSGRGGGLFYCAEGCPGTWLGDKTCDTKCDTPACGFDAGDCGADAVYGGGVPGAEAVRGATPEERRSRAEALVGAAADAIRAASEAAAARCHAAAAANASAAPNATECAAEARAVASRVAAPDGPRLHVLADEAAVTLEEPVFSGALHINISDVVIGAARAVLRMQGCVHGTAGASRNASRAELLDDDVPDHAPCRPTSVDDVRVSWTSAEHDDDAEPWLPVSVLAPHASLLVAVADVANLPSAEDAARAGAARRRAMLLRASAAPPGNGSTAAARTAACDGLEPFAAGAATLASSSEPSAAAVRLARCALRPGPGATAPGPSAVDDEWGFWARVGPALAAANGALPPGTRVPVARLRLRLRVDVMRQGLALDLPVVVLRSVPEPPAAADGGDDDDDDAGRGGGRGRRLDTYGDSLVFTNSILSSVVGRRNRKVPAHMPHMIDRVEMGKLQAWPAMAPAWEATSARRFRDPEDVQYAFAFFYWVMEAAEEVGEGRREALERFWRREVDVNGDGVVDDNEFRTLAAVVQGGKVLPEDLERIRACVAPAGNVTTRVERRPDGSSATVTEVATPAITLDGLARCKASMDPVSKRVKLRGEPTHSIGAEEEVAFEMVGDDYNETLAKLDSVRSRRAKFVCINDDMTLAPEPLRRALREFYESYFPHPCELELPPGRENAHLYIKPLLAHARALWAVLSPGGRDMGLTTGTP